MIGIRRRQLAGLVLLGTAGWRADAASFRDPLDVPAPFTRLADRTPLAAVTRAGERLVAVGLRGLIVLSDDGGRQWRQVSVPVSTELVGVQFVTSQKGWAVGHGGVVLHSSDGGQTWVKQLDGRMAVQILKGHFQSLAQAGDTVARRLLRDVELNYEQGPEQALLGVWFEDEQVGFVCGSFGTLLATRDGGKTWASYMEKVDAEDPMHFNAIRGFGGGLYIASERGTVYRLDRQTQRFVASATGYRGSFFGLTGRGANVIAFGLRGTAYRSRDGGRNWDTIKTGTNTTINGGTVLADGRVLLVTQDGQVLRGDAEDESFKALPTRERTPFQDVAQVNASSVIVVGGAGPQLVFLK